MAEFKKLSEVEQIEAASDNATVLIEEGGDIKRVPKSAVGGAGGYVVVITENDLNNPIVSFNGIVVSANYDELYDVLYAGGSAWVDMSVMFKDNPSALIAADVSPTVQENLRLLIASWCITDIGLIAYTFD